MGLGRCLGRIGALPEKLVWDREAAIAGGGRPSYAFAGFCGQLSIGGIILEPGDAQAKPPEFDSSQTACKPRG